jgi:cold shock protein
MTKANDCRRSSPRRLFAAEPPPVRPTNRVRVATLFLKERAVALGTVKWFDAVKGYGFIKPDGGGQDVFVHISAAEKAGYTTLSEGLKIRYELLTTRAGKTAAAAAFASPV